ncbi:MAG: TonB-dependent receptor [Ferruginibacter sp.]|nr:TonB-dependent receptor [Cytophagales bacterium]
MKRIYLFWIGFLGLFPVTSHGQEAFGTVVGTVTNPQQAPLSGVTVQLVAMAMKGVTDGAGKFALDKLPAGPQKLLFTHVGFQSAQVEVIIQAARATQVAIVLLPVDYQLGEVTVKGNRSTGEITRLPPVHAAYLTTGKKNEVITLGTTHANVAEKTGRQIFAKIPGAFVYDMDGSGNQVNVATRGLDPHRSWEYNVRQNGVMTNSDLYGYPASHYSPPLESVEKIELIRGTASLQYGAQFGGMLHYVTKGADTSKAFSLESIHSVGSYGLRSSYHAVGGKIGRLRYYAYYYQRGSEGYRDHSQSNAGAQFIQLAYQLKPAVLLKAELGRSGYRYRLPGPLTDSMFHRNPRQSTRSRNHFSPDIYLPSLTLDWKLSARTRLSWITSAVLGTRKSVLLDAFADVPDQMDPVTGEYKPRQVDIDRFNSYTSELRLLSEYRVGPFRSTVAGGLQLLRNRLHRQQLGKGTTGSDFDLSLSDAHWGRDLWFNTRNLALFVENVVYLTPALSLAPGLRFEYGETHLTGVIRYYEPENVPRRIRHRFPLLGMNLQYNFNAQNRFYAGWSQAYRPVLFKDVIPGSVLERVDQNLRDASGYNAEMGVSGHYQRSIHYDISVFHLQYNHRLGNLVLTDSTSKAYVYKTNVGNSRTRGVEVYLEVIPVLTNRLAVSFFTATAYLDAIYQKGSRVVGNENYAITGNRVESVPRWMSRNGTTVRYRGWSATLQYSYVGKTFSDAANTVAPTPNGAKGLVPAYGIWDLNATLLAGKHYQIRMGMNNLFNRQYFTKRPAFYPGPGIWPSDGRSMVVTVGIKL